MMGAVIVSFFLQSHVITGALFPDFAQIGMEAKYYPSPSSQSTAGEAEERKELAADISAKPKAHSQSGLLPLRLIYPSTSLALLIVWSFLAGFSERLVPTILQDTETSIGKSTASGKIA